MNVIVKLPKVKSLKQNLGRKFLPGCILTLYVLQAMPALAQYRPPSRPTAPGSPTTTTGRRGGCSGSETTHLTTLAPSSHVGQTISTHPTFAWFVPNVQPLPLQFYLYEDGENGNRQLLYQTELESVSGMMSLALPQTQPALQVGKTYSWQVVLLCNPNRPSSALVAGAELKVVEMPANLATNLTTTADRTDRIDLYAEQGLWYDAFAEALAINPETGSIRLLEDLAQLEELNGKPTHSTQLKQVIEVEQQGS